MNGSPGLHARSRLRTLFAAGVAIVAAAAALLVLRWPRGPLASDEPLRLLIEAAARDQYRDVQPRLAGGFSWLPVRPTLRGDNDTTSLTLRADAAAIFVRLRTDTSPRSQHTSAVAALIAGDSRGAAEHLEQLLRTAADAATWNDFAAALYVCAVRDDDPAQLARALAAADEAIRHDARLAEAHFNRALILERFGLRDQAREAWEVHNRLDTNSEWTLEANEHVRNLQPLPAFRDVLEHAYPRLQHDANTAHAFARQYPEESRLWGETEILGRWATAENAGDHTTATAHLGVAREFAAELARNGGDRMLYGLVAAIDRGDERQRGVLASAHLAFRDAQKTYRARQPGNAERLFVAAADAFARGDSPGVLLARYFAGNTAYSQGRIQEAQRKLERLLEESPPAFSAHRAQVLWQVGLNHFAAAEWGRAIDALTESIATFERLHERGGAANVRQILAATYEQIGNREQAWRLSMITLRDLGQRPSARLQTMLHDFGRTEARNRNWNAAVSFLALAADMGNRIGDAAVNVETLTDRAMVSVVRNDWRAAVFDVQEARARMAAVRDPAYQRLLGANLNEVEALLAPSPQAAVELLTTAIDFHRSEGRRMYLPELFLERGRAFTKLREHDRARADIEAGVAELESQRETLHAGEDRWGIFHDADDLFDAAIDLALDRRDTATAFRYAERARARGLLDVLGSRWPAMAPADIPNDTVLIEYALQQHRLVIFAVESRGIRATTVPVDAEAVVAAILRLRNTGPVFDRRAFREAGRSLYRILVEPVEAEVTGRSRIVFVPDPGMGGVPFAALVDSAGAHLIESAAIAVAPSAAVHVELARQPPRRRERLLLVTGSDDLNPLAWTRREANLIAGSYPAVIRLSRDSATADSFVALAPDADVIHFGGHGVASNELEPNGFLVMAGAGGNLEIAKIASMHLRRTSLVVLAACDTAAGRVRSTEGTISVARAFIAAGVPSVIATLQAVDDEDAARFFPRIHQYVARGLEPGEALRAAQIDAINDPNERSGLWAAVQLIGR